MVGWLSLSMLAAVTESLPWIMATRPTGTRVRTTPTNSGKKQEIEDYFLSSHSSYGSSGFSDVHFRVQPTFHVLLALLCFFDNPVGAHSERSVLLLHK
jgi:hypothetical protein